MEIRGSNRELIACLESQAEFFVQRIKDAENCRADPFRVL